jgi:hypothetical protein
MKSPDSPVNIVMGYGLEGRGSILSRGKFFLLSVISTPALGHTQPPIQCVPEVKRPRREVDHSTPSCAKVKNGGAITPLPHIVLNSISTGKILHFTATACKNPVTFL